MGSSWERGQDPEKPHCTGEWRSLHRTPEEATEVGGETAIEVRFQELGVVSPVRCCRDPGRGEKGSLDLHKKTTGNPARAPTVERMEEGEEQRGQ